MSSSTEPAAAKLAVPKAQNSYTTPRINTDHKQLSEQKPIYEEKSTPKKTEEQPLAAQSFDEASVQTVWKKYLDQEGNSMVGSIFKKAKLEVEPNRIRILVENTFAKSQVEKKLQELGIFLRQNLRNHGLELSLALMESGAVPKFDKIESLAKNYPILEDFRRVFELELST